MMIKKNKKENYIPDTQERVLVTLFRMGKEYAPLIFQIGSLLFLLFSFYLTTRIAPIAESNRSAVARIEAIEEYNDKNAELIPRFLVTEERVNRMYDDIQEIKNTQKEILKNILER